MIDRFLGMGDNGNAQDMLCRRRIKSRDLQVAVLRENPHLGVPLLFLDTSNRAGFGINQKSAAFGQGFQINFHRVVDSLNVW